MTPEDWIQHFAIATVKDAAETASRATEWAVSINSDMAQTSYKNLTYRLCYDFAETAEYVYGEET